MADKKISDLTAATSIADGDYFEIENAGGNSRKVAASVVKDYSGAPLISEVVTSSSAANVTFSSIASTYRDLEIRVRGRGDASATNVAVLIQFNSDTGANYDWGLQEESGGAGAAQTGGIADTKIRVGLISAATAPASSPGEAIVHVLDYKGTTFHKGVLSISGAKLGTTTATQTRDDSNGTWRSTSAINAVKVFLSSGNFVDGSVVSLYGRM